MTLTDITMSIPCPRCETRSTLAIDPPDHQGIDDLLERLQCRCGSPLRIVRPARPRIWWAPNVGVMCADRGDSQVWQLNADEWIDLPEDAVEYVPVEDEHGRVFTIADQTAVRVRRHSPGLVPVRQPQGCRRCGHPAGQRRRRPARPRAAPGIRGVSDETDSLLLWLDDIYPRDPRAADLRRTWPKLAEILDDLTGAKVGGLAAADEGEPVKFIVGPSDETLAALEAFMATPRDERMTP